MGPVLFNVLIDDLDEEMEAPSGSLEMAPSWGGSAGLLEGLKDLQRDSRLSRGV